MHSSDERTKEKGHTIDNTFKCTISYKGRFTHETTK